MVYYTNSEDSSKVELMKRHWLERPFVRSESGDYAVRPFMKLTIVLSTPQKRDLEKSTHT